MQLTPSTEVREGQVIAREVRDARGRILLSRGQRLTASQIARLMRFRIQGVYVRDGVGEEEPELLKPEIRQKCQEVLSDSFSKLSELASIKQLALDATAIQRATDSLIEALMSNQNPLISLLDVSSTSDRLMMHSVSSAVLAITLGLDLGLTQDMLSHLGSAMMFHDIGMMFVPDAVYNKVGQLLPQEVKMLRDHVKLGAAHLAHTNAVSKVAASVVLRHHEMMDGSGYPEGVTGDKISLLGRVAAVAEVYDSLTSPRTYAPAVMPDVAITYMINNAGKLFAREVVLALCRRVALYPTGTAVQLNTGERGIVAGTQPNLPMRPAIRVVCDHKGRPFQTPPLLDLTRDPARFVTRSAPNLALLDTDKCRVIRPQQVSPASTLG